MSLPAIRSIQAPAGADFSMRQMIADIDANFQLLKQAPRLIAVDPGAGVIRFLVLESDGTWNEWSLLAGAGVSFVQNNTARTLTIKSP